MPALLRRLYAKRLFRVVKSDEVCSHLFMFSIAHVEILYLNCMKSEVNSRIIQKILNPHSNYSFLSALIFYRLIMPLIRFADAELFAHLEASLTEPYFATSWLITWLSHDIRECLCVMCYAWTTCYALLVFSVCRIILYEYDLLCIAYMTCCHYS